MLISPDVFFSRKKATLAVPTLAVRSVNQTSQLDKGLLSLMGSSQTLTEVLAAVSIFVSSVFFSWAWVLPLPMLLPGGCPCSASDFSWPERRARLLVMLRSSSCVQTVHGHHPWLSTLRIPKPQSWYYNLSMNLFLQWNDPIRFFFWSIASLAFCCSCLVIFTKEVMFSPLSVGLFVGWVDRKYRNGY